MKRLMILAIFVVMLPIVVKAGMFEQGAVTWDADSTVVSVSSFAVTQLMTRDAYIYRSYVINPSTFGVCLSSYASTVAVSTTSSPVLLPNSVFSLDGETMPWWGGLWGIMCGPGTATPTTTKISVIRTK